MKGGGGNNCSYKMCKAPVKMSPQTNQYPVYLQAGCPSSCPANSVKALKGSWSHLYIILLQNIEAQVDWIDLLVSHAPLHVICCVCGVCVCVRPPCSRRCDFWEPETCKVEWREYSRNSTTWKTEMRLVWWRRQVIHMQMQSAIQCFHASEYDRALPCIDYIASNRRNSRGITRCFAVGFWQYAQVHRNFTAEFDILSKISML